MIFKKVDVFNTKEMKHTALSIFVFASIFTVVAAPALAATISLSNGGVGQVATNPSQFGIAVCNDGASALAQGVPVTVSTNGQTVALSSANSIAVGSCGYTYLSYSQFGMQAGQTYTVTTTIDPKHTVTSNTNNSAEYSVTVPAQQAAAGPQPDGLTANAAVQFTNPLTAFWNWLMNLFGAH
jgi:hypothetical protein